MKVIDFVEREEYYQNFRDLIDGVDPDQRVQYLDLLRNVSKLSKKQINMFGGFAMRYEHENRAVDRGKDEKALEASIIYSILEKLAEQKGIKIEKRRLDKELGPGFTCRFTEYNGDPVIALDTGLFDKKLNQELAHALGYSQIMVGDSACNMIICENRAKVATLDKQAHNFGTMLIDGIKWALSLAN